LVDLLVLCGASTSKRQAREFITNHSVMINGEKVNDLELIINQSVAIGGRYVIIRRGKKNYYLVKL
jgi:tyrosyl-tRNA synthetase